MKTIGLFYGTRTGETMDVAELIKKAFEEQVDDIIIKVHDVSDITIADLRQYDNLILGTSTYKSGDLEPDWEYFYNDFKNIDLTGKAIALFGLGNSLEYADTFSSGMGILGRTVFKNNGTLIGLWPTEGYDYDYSYAEYDNNHFYGLVLDQDYESEMTEERVDHWVQQLIEEFNACDKSTA